jgi:outer membrane protein TolC
MSVVRYAGWLLLCAGLSCEAADLPSDDAVRRILSKSPAAQTSAGLIAAGQAQRRKLELGAYEWNLTLEAQHRRTRPGEYDVGGNTKDWAVGAERAWRLPGKAALDNELGESAASQAAFSAQQSRREAARALLADWFEWLRSDARWRQTCDERDLLQREAEVVRRRKQLGDAARLDVVQIEAALAQSQSRATALDAERAAAAGQLRELYPGLLLPERPELGAPVALEGAQEIWVDALLGSEPALNIARLEAQRGRLQTRRSELERQGDPTIGLRYASEQDGGDKLLGVFVKIPLGRAARQADADLSAAEAGMAQARALQLERQLRAQATAAWRRAQSAFGNWQYSREAATKMEETAAMQARAYELGETELAALLNARRLAHAALLDARLSQLDALESRYRLMLDSGKLWRFEAE